ncbi:MAG: glycosyltransferase family 39 protein, partial [Chloroflexota bacterium]
MTSSQRDTNITLALLLLIFGFWLWGLEWLHMRPDEHLVYMHTDYDSVVGAVTYQATRDVQAPLWHSFFWTWRQLVGDSEFAGRYQGVLWSTITLAMLYRLLHDTFDAPRYGWLAMTFVAVNAHFFTYAFEIRPYPIVLLGSVFSAWCLLRWLDSPTWGRALRYGGSLALLAYTHYFTAFWVAAQWIYAAFQPSARRAWQQLAGATLLAGAVWGIWFPVFLGQVAALRRIDGTFGIGSTTTATSWSVIEQLALLASNGLPLLLIALFAVGLFTVRRREYAFLLLWAVGAPAIALTANLFASVYDTRYVVYMSLGVGAATAVSLGSLRRVWLPLSLVVMALMLWRLPSHLPDREPYRTIFQGMSAASHPDDLLFFDEADLERSYVRWLLNQYTDPILLENGTLDFDEAAHARRVWHITSKLLDPDVQSNFRELE